MTTDEIKCVRCPPKATAVRCDGKQRYVPVPSRADDAMIQKELCCRSRVTNTGLLSNVASWLSITMLQRIRAAGNGRLYSSRAVITFRISAGFVLAYFGVLTWKCQYSVPVLGLVLH